MNITIHKKQPLAKLVHFQHIGFSKVIYNVNQIIFIDSLQHITIEPHQLYLINLECYFQHQSKYNATFSPLIRNDLAKVDIITTKENQIILMILSLIDRPYDIQPFQSIGTIYLSNFTANVYYNKIFKLHLTVDELQLNFAECTQDGFYKLINHLALIFERTNRMK
jgi:hypothetical protein